MAVGSLGVLWGVCGLVIESAMRTWSRTSMLERAGGNVVSGRGAGPGRAAGSPRQGGKLFRNRTSFPQGRYNCIFYLSRATPYSKQTASGQS